MPRRWLHKLAHIEAVQEYVDGYKHRLGLSDTPIRIERGLPPTFPGLISYAHIQFVDGECRIRLCRSFFKKPELWQRRTIAHELAHILIRPLSEMVGAMGECSRTTRRRGPTDAAVSLVDEEVVCRLEPLLAELLPPLPWAEGS